MHMCYDLNDVRVGHFSVHQNDSLGEETVSVLFVNSSL